MRRIYLIFMVRNLAPLAFDSLIVVLLAVIATFFVSFGDVWVNLGTAKSGGGLSQFSLTAVSDTELETKFLLLVLGVVGFLAVRDLKRAVRAVRTLKEGKSQITNHKSQTIPKS
ncbi:MAG: hypothetical protein AAB699_01480 [Patescibacteria group bacterium]